MKAKEKRVQILDLQDQHCHECEHRTKPHEYCISNCEIGREIQQLGTELFKEHAKRQTQTKEKWDERCRKAVAMKEEGISYYQISKILDCDSGSLYKYLKKRGLYK
ncbi:MULTISPECIES: zinc-finger domain-containing protein [Bacillus cereus group]|uniref:zinc-finger domain-containing protein n=1 Tax=Bacillus cereus group TaxID=86661 RepID=UPI000BFDC81C|nr:MULTISPECIES: zinc-finger domain-containing protein [Bacillus cereus group]PGQ44800.1 hypothetical protein COA20_29210 [Bacillus thuringiensis]PGV68650.1 hypothetical protein COD84_29810 [Bacillus cereus]